MQEIFIYKGYLIDLTYQKYGDFYHAQVFKSGKKYDSCQSEDKDYCLSQAKNIVDFSIESEDL